MKNIYVNLGKERVRVDPKAPSGCCAVCRREPDSEERRLRLTVRVKGRLWSRRVTFLICRSCLSEYAPRGLTVIESEAARAS